MASCVSCGPIVVFSLLMRAHMTMPTFTWPWDHFLGDASIAVFFLLVCSLEREIANKKWKKREGNLAPKKWNHKVRRKQLTGHGVDHNPRSAFNRFLSRIWDYMTFGPPHVFISFKSGPKECPHDSYFLSQKKIKLEYYKESINLTFSFSNILILYLFYNK